MGWLFDYNISPLEGRYILYPISFASSSDIYVKRKKTCSNTGWSHSNIQWQKHLLISHLAYFSKWVSIFTLCISSFIKNILVVYIQETHSLLNLKFLQTKLNNCCLDLHYKKHIPIWITKWFDDKRMFLNEFFHCSHT